MQFRSCRCQGSRMCSPYEKQAVQMSPSGRFCCKSLFALVIKISFGFTRDFRVKMWGTSSPDDKLTGDLGNVIEATRISGRRSCRLMAGKSSPSNFGLLQQYRHTMAMRMRQGCPRLAKADARWGSQSQGDGHDRDEERSAHQCISRCE